jgi:hypothetical protein
MLGQDKTAVQICVRGGRGLNLNCFAGLLLRVEDVVEDIGVTEELQSVGGHLDLHEGKVPQVSYHRLMK